jgi:two-component system, chemotaxis family, CheB/CheR fusion protein
MNIRERVPEGLKNETPADAKHLDGPEICEPYRTKRIAKDGAVIDVWITATALVNETGQVYAIAPFPKKG